MAEFEVIKHTKATGNITGREIVILRFKCEESGDGEFILNWWPDTGNFSELGLYMLTRYGRSSLWSKYKAETIIEKYNIKLLLQMMQ